MFYCSYYGIIINVFYFSGIHHAWEEEGEEREVGMAMSTYREVLIENRQPKPNKNSGLGFFNQVFSLPACLPAVHKMMTFLYLCFIINYC